MTKIVKIGFVVVISSLVLTASSVGFTQKKGKGGDGVIRLEETVIEGRVAKPNAFFINTRQAMVYDSMLIKESFVKEIPRAVRNGPF